jgi:hypothetical protein
MLCNIRNDTTSNFYGTCIMHRNLGNWGKQIKQHKCGFSLYPTRNLTHGKHHGFGQGSIKR